MAVRSILFANLCFLLATCWSECAPGRNDRDHIDLPHNGHLTEDQQANLFLNLIKHFHGALQAPPSTKNEAIVPPSPLANLHGSGRGHPVNQYVRYFHELLHNKNNPVNDNLQHAKVGNYNTPLHHQRVRRDTSKASTTVQETTTQDAQTTSTATETPTTATEPTTTPVPQATGKKVHHGAMTASGPISNFYRAPWKKTVAVWPLARPAPFNWHGIPYPGSRYTRFGRYEDLSNRKYNIQKVPVRTWLSKLMPRAPPAVVNEMVPYSYQNCPEPGSPPSQGYYNAQPFQEHICYLANYAKQPQDPNTAVETPESREEQDEGATNECNCENCKEEPNCPRHRRSGKRAGGRVGPQDRQIMADGDPMLMDPAAAAPVGEVREGEYYEDPNNMMAMAMDPAAQGCQTYELTPDGQQVAAAYQDPVATSALDGR